MNVLITGSMGQLGRSFRRSFLNLDHECFFTDLHGCEDVVPLDITDAGAVCSYVRDHGIDVIINCAAYTDVNKAEDEEELAFRINADAAGNLAAAAVETGAVLVHFSTDYVFDGKSHLPYSEDMPACPVNAYGRTKLAGEKAIEASGCRYMIFRTAWLYSSFGKNFVKTMVELTAERQEISVVYDQVGTPTYAQDLADTVAMIIDGGNLSSSGIYHYTDEGVCSWYDLAREVNDLLGHFCNVNPCRTADYPTRAARPHYSVLDKHKVRNVFGIDIPHWKESLYCCIDEMKKRR